MSPTARASVNLRAVQRNFARVKEVAPTSRVLSVVKADAYGHGLLQVAQALSQSEGFAVARMDEAMVLRNAGIEKRLVVLSGASTLDDFRDACRYNIDVVVHHHTQIDNLERLSNGSVLRVWCKVDSGMHRLGFAPEELMQAIARLERCAAVKEIDCVLSHFACADEGTNANTDAQLKRFLDVTATVPMARSIANSAGILQYSRAHLDWVRPGVMLYGISPLRAQTAMDLNLIPAMTLSTRLIAVNHLPAGSPVGYGGTWQCPETMPVGVAAVGYGDGYPRHAPSGTPVLLDGVEVPLVGRVSMDTITLDLRGVVAPHVGQDVTLWGAGLPAERVAEASGTIAYELVTRVGRRVHMEHTDA